MKQLIKNYMLLISLSDYLGRKLELASRILLLLTMRIYYNSLPKKRMIVRQRDEFGRLKRNNSTIIYPDLELPSMWGQNKQ